ncbi:TOMM precursor leader peptide-binding protein [Amycolatopsis circi]|uniref:TOMM precursor leader peptide-binding protein n=1 Tax=Amycolatopsis circi TaxID=871959 RepID=UPI000E24626A|nr:TOMM precursor leader peptide-binding protein [Amycolatopsis circi]
MLTEIVDDRKTVEVVWTGTALDENLAAIQSRISTELADLGAPLIRIATLGTAAQTDVSGEAGLRILPVWLYQAGVLCGPGYQISETGPCPRCLHTHWLANRSEPERESLETFAEIVQPRPQPDLTGFALTALAALVRHLAENGSSAEVYRFRMDSWQVDRFQVLADPDCPVCGQPVADTADTAVISLRSRSKPHLAATRLKPVRDYRLDAESLVNPVCGPLGVRTVKAYQVGPTAPVNGFFRARAKLGLHQMSWSGHANNYADSLCYGLLEGLERYAGQSSRGRTPGVLDTYRNVADHALDPRETGCYAPDFYQAEPHYQPYRPDLPLQWVWGFSLREQRPLLVPEQAVYYLDRLDRPPLYIQECSNGCAGGSCVEEAILHGLLELVERDAFLLNWYAKRSLPEIDVSTCDNPEIGFTCDRLRLLGYRPYLFDMRVDLPIPAVMAVIRRKDERLGTLCFSAGASLDPVDAVRAALCEAASYVTDLADRMSTWLPRLRAMVHDYDQVVHLSHHSMLYGLPEMAPHAGFLFDGPAPADIAGLYSDWTASPRSADLTMDLRRCLELVFPLSDLIVVDQTTAHQRALGMHTVRVIAPGLVPIDFGWRRQRVLHHQRLAALLDGKPAHPHPHPFP